MSWDGFVKHQLGLDSIDVSDTELVVACDDGPRTFRRTTELPVRNLKADRPRKVSNEV
jgi:hypothetical protein